MEKCTSFCCKTLTCCFVSERERVYCLEVVKDVINIPGITRRTFQFKKMLLTLHKSLVRPHLSYCVQFWSSYLQEDVDGKEKVQRRATSLNDINVFSLCSKNHLST